MRPQKPLTVHLLEGSQKKPRVPAAASRAKYKPGASFGVSSAKTSPHNQRIQDICSQLSTPKKRQRFAWKMDHRDSQRPFLSPLRGRTGRHKSRLRSKPVAPFGTLAKKTSWFDSFHRIPEDEDESLCRDKLHFALIQLARSERVSVFERDRLSWAKQGVYIDRSLHRGLSSITSKVKAKTNVLLSSSESSRAYMQRYPADVGKRDMGSKSKPLAACTYSVMKSKSKRMSFVDPQGSGLAPPQVQIGEPCLNIARPGYSSSAFLSSSRDHKVPNQR